MRRERPGPQARSAPSPAARWAMWWIGRASAGWWISSTCIGAPGTRSRSSSTPAIQRHRRRRGGAAPARRAAAEPRSACSPPPRERKSSRCAHESSTPGSNNVALTDRTMAARLLAAGCHPARQPCARRLRRRCRAHPRPDTRFAGRIHRHHPRAALHAAGRGAARAASLAPRRPQELTSQQSAEAALAPDTAHWAAPVGSDSSGQDALVNQRRSRRAPGDIRNPGRCRSHTGAAARVSPTG